jgi:hypothetical protein
MADEAVMLTVLIGGTSGSWFSGDTALPPSQEIDTAANAINSMCLA